MYVLVLLLHCCNLAWLISMYYIVLAFLPDISHTPRLSTLYIIFTNVLIKQMHHSLVYLSLSLLLSLPLLSHTTLSSIPSLSLFSLIHHSLVYLSLSPSPSLSHTPLSSILLCLSPSLSHTPLSSIPLSLSISPSLSHTTLSSIPLSLSPSSLSYNTL